MGIAAKIKPIALKWNEKERTVLLEPEDQDRFALTVEEAIAACRAYAPQERADMKRRFDALLDRLGAWVAEHKKKVAKAFFTIRDSNFLFLVVMKGRGYDPDLTGELTELDIEIARSGAFKGLRLSVQELPNVSDEDCAAFLNPHLTLVYGGQGAERKSPRR